MPNNRTSQAPPFTFNRNELPSGDEGERLERILRRIQLAFNSIDFPVPPPLNLDALAAKLRPLLEAPGAFPLNLTALIPSSSGNGGISIEDTHAVRLAVYTPPTVPLGSLYYETDRTALYTVYNSSGTLVWKYVAGVMYNTLANRPVDLGVNDVGFQFVNSNADTNTLYVWTGTEFITVSYYQLVTDAATNPVVHIDSHRATAAAGAPGVGYSLDYQHHLDNADKAEITATTFRSRWIDATAGSEDSALDIYLTVASLQTLLLTLLNTGNLLLTVGDYVWQSGTANTGTLTHTNTGNRAYQFPDADGDITFKTVAALTASALVLGDGTAKVKVLGSLGTTTTVLHGNAAGDPTFAAVSLTADVSGILPVANGGTGVSNATQTYTPTHSALTNLDTTTPRLTSYYRVGNVVTLAGGFSADPTAAGACSFEMSLPIASDFANTFEAGGTSALVVGAEPGGISAVVANDTLIVQWVAAGTADAAYTFTATYRVI